MNYFSGIRTIRVAGTPKAHGIIGKCSNRSRKRPERSNTHRIQGFVSKTALHPVWVSDVLEMGPRIRCKPSQASREQGQSTKQGATKFATNRVIRAPSEIGVHPVLFARRSKGTVFCRWKTTRR